MINLLDCDPTLMSHKITLDQMGVVLNVDGEQDEENADPNSGAAGKEEREREREKERDGGREKETRRGGATPRHDLHDLHDLRSTRKQRQ